MYRTVRKTFNNLVTTVSDQNHKITSQAFQSYINSKLHQESWKYRSILPFHLL